jgi:hypothetical protein
MLSHFARPSVAHWPFGQVMLVGVEQSPALLQTEAVVTLSPSHLAAAQTVESPG